MSCRDFERRLEAWLLDELSTRERAACDRHLSRCSRCRELAELGQTACGEEPPPDLLPGILARTSGPVFDPVWAALEEDLPKLAELDPGPDFTREVLERTRREPLRRPSLGARLRRGLSDAWTAWVRRPRFAWELAYVLLLLAMPWVARMSPPMASGIHSLTTTAEEVSRQAADLGAKTGSGMRTFGTRLASSLERAADTTQTDNLDEETP